MSWESFDLVAKLRAAFSASRLDFSSSSSSSCHASCRSNIDGMLEDLEHVERIWRTVKAKIPHAEAREIGDESIREWLRDLRDLAYMMEDVHDLCEYQLAANQVSLQHGRSQDENYLPLEDPRFWMDVADRVVIIKKRFHDIAETKEGLSLGEGKSLNVHDDDSGSSFASRPPTGSLPGSKLMGREDEIEELLQLLQTEHGDENVEVIALVGIGGVGKTSLAQHAFRHFKGTEQFDTTAWVFVSEDFDLIRLMKDTLYGFTKEIVKETELSTGVLQEKLHKYVSGKKFFLVMDDIWNREWESWETFFSPFLRGGKGSKILITTREEAVARTAGAVSFIKLGRLSEEDGWSLFQQHAFQSPDEEHVRELVDIGKDIVKKCGGLPLAIKVLGRSLRSNKGDQDEWMHVLESNPWDVVPIEHDQQILGPLYLSYLRLPAHLKTCFRFCSFFRKGKKIGKKDLIESWIAHNLITVYDDGPTAYEAADRYIDDLKSRSFFEYETDPVSNMIDIKIHHLLFDVLQHISGYEFSDQRGRSSLVRHVKIHQEQGNPRTIDAANLRTLEVIRPNQLDQSEVKVSSAGSLRLLSIRPIYDYGFFSACINVSNVDELLFKSKLLRFLTISHARIIRMPQSLFELYNLMYLNLRACEISELSESISNLTNLRHLDLSFTLLKRVPDAMVELTNLRSLYIDGTMLQYMPRGISRLKGLEVLDCFVAGRTGEGEVGLQELGDLARDHPMDCRPTFAIYALERVRTKDVIEDDILLNIPCRDLWLSWEAMYHDDQFSSRPTVGPEQEVVLNKLRPHSCIEELHMQDYKGSNLPAWMGDKSFVNLVAVILLHLEECTSISSLGELPFLERLDLYAMSSLREVVSPVQSLSGSDDHILSFPKLTVLDLYACSSIICIPLYRFPALTRFYIADCDSLQTIADIGITECEQFQFPSEMAVPRCLKMLYIEKCAKLSRWVRSNRSTILRDVREVTLDDKPISLKNRSEGETYSSEEEAA